MDISKVSTISHKLRPHLPGNLRRSISWRVLPILVLISLLVGMISLSLPIPASAYHEGEQTAEFLPPDTQLYLTVNLDPSEDQLTKLWGVLNYWWQDPNVQDTWGEKLGSIQDESGIDIEQDVLPWLGPEIAIGSNPISETGQWTESVIFIGTMNKEASDTFFEDKLVPYLTDETGIPGNYDGIETLYFAGEQVYCAFTNEYIIVSFNQSFLEARLDMILDPALPSLADEANFQEAQSAITTDRVGMFYCNYEYIWDEIIQATPVEQQEMLEAFSTLIPPYCAASLYFTTSGMSSIAYSPLPESITLSTEPDLLKSAGIVPDDALFYASAQDTAKVYWQAYEVYLETAWSQIISTIEAELSGMTFEEAVNYLATELGVDLDAFWAEVVPHITELSDKNFEEAIVYLTGEMGLDLETFWAEVTPYLSDLSGMTFNQALYYLATEIGLDLDTFWSEVTPYLTALSGKTTFGEALDYLTTEIGLDLDVAFWDNVVPYLTDLSGMTFAQAINYLATEIGLDLDAAWADIAPHLSDLSSMTVNEAIIYINTELELGLDTLWTEGFYFLAHCSGMTFDEAIVCLAAEFDLDLNALWADVVPYLTDLSGMTFAQAINYLATEIGLDLDAFWAEVTPYLSDLSGMTFNEALYYLATEIGLDLDTFWSEVTPYLTVLSSTTTFGEALDYLTAEIGLDLDVAFWDNVIPYLTDLSGMTFAQALDYLTNEIGLDLDTVFWDNVVPYLTELSGMTTFDQVIDYINVTLGIDTAWTEIVSMIVAEAQESFDEAMADLDQAIVGMDGECAIALLPISSDQQMPDILLMSEVDDVSGMQQNLDNLVDIMEPWLLQTSETTIDGVPVTLFTNGYIADAGASPGYLFRSIDTTQFLVIGSTENALTAAVGASQDSIASLDEAEEYQGVLSLLPESRMSLGYLNITKILDTIVSQVSTEGMSEEEMVNFELLSSCIPSKSALAYSTTVVNTDEITMTGAFFLSPALSTAFVVSDLVINPTVVKVGESVTITAEVSNTSIASGNYTVSLKLNGVVVDTKQVPVEGGASATVSFTVTKDEAGTYTVDVNGLSGSLVVLTPAGFQLSDITINPSTVEVGESVTITAKVTNTGETTGSYTVSLKLDGVVVDTEEVTLAGGASETVSFTVTKDEPGTYTVGIEGLTGDFTVSAAEEDEGAPTNWALIGGIIGGVIAAAAIVAAILLRRRRRAAV